MSQFTNESKIQPIDFQSPTADQDFFHSMKTYGFAVLREVHTQAEISTSLIDENYSAWQAFFLSNDEAQAPFLFQESTQDGLIRKELSETAKGFKRKDIKEFYHFYLNGRCPEHLQACTTDLYKKTLHVAKQLLNWLEAYTPEDIKNKHQLRLSETVTDSPNTLLRILHSPPFDGSEEAGAIRAQAHEDINMITLIPRTTAPGLQTKDPNTNEWLDIPFAENWWIVNAGDMLQAWSDGFYKAATHRVINPDASYANEPRLSMPMFIHPRDEVYLSDQYPTAVSYRHERLRELGLLKTPEDTTTTV